MAPEVAAAAAAEPADPAQEAKEQKQEQGQAAPGEAGAAADGDDDGNEWEEETVEGGVTVGETLCKGVPVVASARPLRAYIPVVPVSAEGKYLEEKVWPILRPSLEKLLLAVEYNTPTEVKAAYPGGANGSIVQRVGRPDDVDADFSALSWLAQYLQNYNPNREQKYDETSAATAIQTAWRGRQARKTLKAKLDARAVQRAAEADAAMREAAASRIQALWRGHCIRQSIALGLAGEFLLVTDAKG